VADGERSDWVKRSRGLGDVPVTVEIGGAALPALSR
jgi:hypothetical protein